MKSIYRIICILTLISYNSIIGSLAQIPPKALVRLLITYYQHSDEALIYLHTNATDGFDQDTYDSPKLLTTTDSVPNIMSWVQNGSSWVKLGINGYAYPPSTGCHYIPLGVKVPGSGDFELSINEIYGFDSAHLNLLLIDTLTGISTPFDSLGTIYNFTATLGDTNFGRLYLRMCPDVPVEIKEKDIHANTNNCTESYWKQVFSKGIKDSRVEVLDLTGRSLFFGSQSDFHEFSKDLKLPLQPVIIKSINSEGVCSRKVIISF